MLGNIHGQLERENGASLPYLYVNKTEFCHTHAIPARLFNALACDLQGLLDGTRELLKERRKDLTKALAREKKQLATRREQLQAVEKDRLRMVPARLHKLKRQAHANTVTMA